MRRDTLARKALEQRSIALVRRPGRGVPRPYQSVVATGAAGAMHASPRSATPPRIGEPLQVCRQESPDWQRGAEA